MKLRYSLLLSFFAVIALIAAPAHAQTEVLLTDTTETNLQIFEPPNVPMPNQYRAGSGAPGPAYWQNEVKYEISITLYPEEDRLEGSETITYTNNSPQNLEFLWLQLDQNLFLPTSIGARITESAQRFSGAFEEGGFQISNVRLVRDGEVIQADYYIEGTEMRVALQRPLSDNGGTLKIKLDYGFIIPKYGADRMGRLKVSEGVIYEIAQWYPRMFVYDDVSGWNVMPYLGQGEFYLEYGAFDVAITVPRDMIVAATGVLQNPEKVLTEEQQEALDEAWQSEETVTIISKEEVGDASTRPDGEGMLTWRFHAENVRDFSWAASSAFIWDAAVAETHDGEPALAQSFYPVESVAEGDAVGWERSTQMIQHSIEFYSDWLAPYPYPVAINVAGIVGGMEYPMIVFCSWQARGTALFGVTDHEFAHEWFPMIVGSDERQHVWMDEGLVTFMGHYSWLEFYNEAAEGMDLTGVGLYQAPEIFMQTLAAVFAENLLDYAADQPIMTYTDRIPAANWGYLGYSKPGYGLVLLREYVVGPELFDTAFKEYFDRWKYKHPQPADFFRTIENVAGENLDWFWNGWFYHSYVLNPALAGVEVDRQENVTRIAVEHRAKMIMPLVVSVTLENGETEMYSIPEEAFFFSDDYTIVAQGIAERVELDPNNILPDVNPQAGVWTGQNGLQPAAIFNQQ